MMLSKISYELYDQVEKLKKTATGRKKILPMLEKYFGNRYSSMTPDEFVDLHNKSKIEDVYYWNVGSYTSLNPQQIEEWASELGITAQDKTFLPANELIDWEELEETLGAEETEKIRKENEGKFRPVDKDLQCGYMTLERLYHSPAYSNKVSSSLFGVDINSRRDQPLMNRGRYRVTGQKIGEMELSALLSSNSRQFIASARNTTAQTDNQEFLNNLLALGLTVQDSRGYNQGGSDLKNRLESMKKKFRLKNNK